MQHLILIWSYGAVISNSAEVLFELDCLVLLLLLDTLINKYIPKYLFCSGLNLIWFNWNKFRKMSTVNIMIHPLNQIWGNGHTEPNSTKLLTEPNLLNLISIEPISQKSVGLNSRFWRSEHNYQNCSYLNSRFCNSEPNYQNLHYLNSSWRLALIHWTK